MPIDRSTPSRSFALSRWRAGLAGRALASCPAAAQPTSAAPGRGTIEGVEGEVLAVKSRAGEDVKLHMTTDLRVVGIVKIPLSDIKVGSFVGATTVPGPDGSQNAVEVHVF